MFVSLWRVTAASGDTGNLAAKTCFCHMSSHEYAGKCPFKGKDEDKAHPNPKKRLVVIGNAYLNNHRQDMADKVSVSCALCFVWH